MARKFVEVGVLWCEWSEWLEWYFQALLVVTSEDGFSSQHAGLLHLRWACFYPSLNKVFFLLQMLITEKTTFFLMIFFT